MTLAETQDHDPELTLGLRILIARRLAKMEQKDIAAACGVSRALVGHWEHDHADPRSSLVKKIAEVTGVPEDWLLGLVDLRRQFDLSVVPDPPVMQSQFAFPEPSALKPVRNADET